jgi:anti-sigma factor RsiW
LLAGGELTGDDRRRAERHVITCSACREHLEALDSTLDLLRLAGDSARQESAGEASLWPALQRQVRESRRSPVSVWNRRKAKTVAKVALAASVLLSLSGLGVWAVHQHFEVVLTVKPRASSHDMARPGSRGQSRTRLVSHREEVRGSAERGRLFDEEPEHREPLARGPWPEPRERNEPTH